MTNIEYKELHGFSKSRYRAMKRNGLDIMSFSDSLAAYKELMKKRRKERNKLRKQKKDAIRAGRRSKDDKKSNKKK